MTDTSQSESEKFFKALNEGRVVLVPPEHNRYSTGGVLYGTFSPDDDNITGSFFFEASRRIAILPKSPEGDERLGTA